VRCPPLPRHHGQHLVPHYHLEYHQCPGEILK
jgi:hypothetical protein